MNIITVLYTPHCRLCLFLLHIASARAVDAPVHILHELHVVRVVLAALLNLTRHALVAVVRSVHILEIRVEVDLGAFLLLGNGGGRDRMRLFLAV